ADMVARLCSTAGPSTSSAGVWRSIKPRFCLRGDASRQVLAVLVPGTERGGGGAERVDAAVEVDDIPALDVRAVLDAADHIVPVPVAGAVHGRRAAEGMDASVEVDDVAPGAGDGDDPPDDVLARP